MLVTLDGVGPRAAHAVRRIAVCQLLALVSLSGAARAAAPQPAPTPGLGHPTSLTPRPAGAATTVDFLGNGSGLPDDFQFPPVSPIASGPVINFESAPVKPVALSNDGSILVATNTPNATLVVFQTTPNGLTKVDEIAVGLDPVSAAFQPNDNRYVWVANAISDNVSIVDLQTSHVDAVIEVGDEPVNVLFNPSGSHAFVITQGSRPLTTYELDPMNLERGQVTVIDTATRAIVSHTFLDCHTPRAAGYDGANDRIVVAALHSGNNTTVVGQPFSLHHNAPRPPFSDLCENACDCDCEHGTLLNWLSQFSATSALFAATPELGPVYPDPHNDPQFPMPSPLVQRIVPDIGQVSGWSQLVDLLSDENGLPDPAMVALLGQEFNISNAFELIDTVIHDAHDTLDHDLVLLDASNPDRPAGLPILRTLGDVGTTLTGLALSGDGRVFVSNMEPRNTIRHEPALRGHIVDHQVRVVTDPSSAAGMATIDLHAGIPDFHDVSVPNAAAQAGSLANPVDLQVSADGGVLYVVALGADRVGAVDTATGAVLGRVDVGRGPRGLVLNAATNRLYVLCRTDLSVQVIDVSNPAAMQVLQARPLFNPEPAEVREGRNLLYSTKVSHNFAMSCEVCHVDGRTDHLPWDLGDPNGALQGSSPNLIDTGTGQGLPNHPLKGPMVTQSLRGLVGHHFFHWRSDKPTLQAFNPAFDGLLGGEQLSPTDIDLFAAFVNSITYPPNPYLNRDNSFKDPVGALPGAIAYTNNCHFCHMVDHDGAMHIEGIEGDAGVNENTSVLFAQLQEVPQLRGIYEKFQSDRYSGVGVLHDGREGNRTTGHPLLTFLADFFGTLSTIDHADITAFVTAFPSNAMSVVGWQVRVPGDGPGSEPGSQVKLNVDVMIAQAAKLPQTCDVIAKGRVGGMDLGFVMLSPTPVPTFESQYNLTYSLATLYSGLSPGDFLVFTAVPPGSGRRLGIDQDMDGAADGVDDFPQHAATGDGNGDGMVDLADFVLFQACLEQQPLPVSCFAFDPDVDGQLTSVDIDAFLDAYAGGQFDCNTNGISDLAEILSGTATDADHDGIPDECPAVSVAPAGSRYLAITALGNQPVTIKVTAMGMFWFPKYVTPSGFLSDVPVVLTPEEWGTVYLADVGINPGGAYLVFVDSASWSASDQASTYAWGDTNNANGVNLDDILCVLRAFSGDFDGTCTLQSADLMGFSPNRSIDLDDILAVLGAFSGQPYAGPLTP